MSSSALQLAQSDQFEAALKGKSGGVLDMTNFLDTTNIDGRFDYSEWVRAYGRYLDETLDVWRKLSFFAVNVSLPALLLGTGFVLMPILHSDTGYL